MEKLLNYTIIALLCAAAVVCGQLEIVPHTREQGSNFIKLECRETFDNGSKATVLNTQLLLFNKTGELVTSLLDREGISYDFSESGVFSFNIAQRVEGYYYCSRDPLPGVDDTSTSARTLLARPRPEEVETIYERHVGESVTLKSGVGEGALAARYTPTFWKDNYISLTDVSRGDDFSLTLSSLQLSDSGMYVPSIHITIGNGEIYSIPNLPTITLTVYQSPVIEVAPTSVVDKEGVSGVSFSCIATGGPLLRLSWFLGDRNLTDYAPPQYSITKPEMNVTTKAMNVLSIQRPSYNDSGRFKCVATIMDGRDGENFKVEESADLTILESEFYLKTTITEHKQVQLWVELKNPISLYPVTAIVYFTPTAQQSGDQASQYVQTHSVITSTTIMVFQLERHDVPDKFQDEDFYIQVALRVNSVDSARVPKTLDTASTANLNQPTGCQCAREETYQTLTIAIGCVSAIAILALFSIIGMVICCMIYKEHQRRRRQANMPTEERNRLERQLEQFDSEVLHSNEPLTPATQQHVNRRVDHIHGQLRGDGPQDPVEIAMEDK